MRRAEGRSEGKLFIKEGNFRRRRKVKGLRFCRTVFNGVKRIWGYDVSVFSGLDGDTKSRILGDGSPS